MKTGDLVKFSSNKDVVVYVVTNDKAYDLYTGKPLPKCVMIAVLEHNAIIPMRKNFLEVISESR